MKTYKHLFEKLIADENILLAIRNASLGKRNRKEVKDMLENTDKYVKFFKRIASNYRNAKHKPKVIYDGVTRKKRTILVPKMYEQVMHHMIVNVLKPIFLKPMYEHSHGSIPTKGAHKAKRYISKWLQKDSKNTKYCLKMDIKKYFESVPHDILKKKLRQIIKDEDFLNVLFTVIDVQEKGLPIGFYTSQWLANFYLTKLDHYIKEVLKAKYYVRYMDDMVILDGNKRKLHKFRQEIDKQLLDLGLQMKSNWQVFKIEYRNKGRPIDFMGFKFYKNRTTLRRTVMLRASRKARRIAKEPKPTVYECRQMLSYIGWISATNTYGFFVNWIKPYVNVRNIRKRISNYDKRRTTKCGINQNQ